MNYRRIFLFSLITILAVPVYAERNLDTKKAQKKEVRHSMIGFRNTLIFYSFKDQQAVLALTIDNKNETFPVKGKVYLFDDKTTDKSLAKWINNRHSDALFADAPEPIATMDLPDGLCKVTSFKKAGTEKNPTNQDVFQTYEIKFSVKDYSAAKKFKLSAFNDTAKAHVKTK